MTKGVANAGFNTFTKWPVCGHCKQMGIKVGNVYAVMVIVDDEDKNKVIDIMIECSQTGQNGNSGDSKIFVLPIEESYTISNFTKDE